MTPHEVLDDKLTNIMIFSTMMPSVDFWFGWYSEEIVVVRICHLDELSSQFSYRIKTEDDVSEFMEILSKKFKEVNEND